MVTQARAWCWGGGVDSTAGIIEDIRRGNRIDLITMADHGSEKQGTYDFLPIFSDWVYERIGIRPTICRYEPSGKTAEKYRRATREVVDALELKTITGVRFDRLAGGIYGNMVANRTLPGITFQVKSCSVKWNLEPHDSPPNASAF